MADAAKEYLKAAKIPLQQLHSVGTDGASAMVGERNSFYSHMKKDVPNLILLKCVCHSLGKCAEYALKKCQMSYIIFFRKLISGLVIARKDGMNMFFIIR